MRATTRTREDWANLIAEADASDLTYSEFCRRNGINISYFHAKRADLKRLGVLQAKTTGFTVITNKGIRLAFRQAPSAEVLAELIYLLEDLDNGVDYEFDGSGEPLMYKSDRLTVEVDSTHNGAYFEALKDAFARLEDTDPSAFLP